MLQLRRAKPKDKQLLLKWRNSEEIYNLGSLKRPVTEDEHSKWFDSIIKNTEQIVLIIEDSKLEIGMIRYDKINDGAWVISIYIIGERNLGRGKGSEALEKSFEFLPIKNRIIAKINSENKRSIKFFEKNRFLCIKKSSEVTEMERIL